MSPSFSLLVLPAAASRDTRRPGPDESVAAGKRPPPPPPPEQPNLTLSSDC